MALPFPYQLVQTAQERKMWIACEHQTYLALQIAKCDTVYVIRKGSCNYAVIGTVGDRDILIKGGIASEKEAKEFAENLVNNL